MRRHHPVVIQRSKTEKKSRHHKNQQQSPSSQNHHKILKHFDHLFFTWLYKNSPRNFSRQTKSHQNWYIARPLIKCLRANKFFLVNEITLLKGKLHFYEENLTIRWQVAIIFEGLFPVFLGRVLFLNQQKF